VAATESLSDRSNCAFELAAALPLELASSVEQPICVEQVANMQARMPRAEDGIAATSKSTVALTKERKASDIYVCKKERRHTTPTGLKLCS